VKRADCLKARIENFFEANPDEWLTLADAVAKWGVTRKQVVDTVSFIKGKGGVVRTEGGIVKTVWSQPEVE